MIDLTLKKFFDKLLNDNGVIRPNGDVKYYCPICRHRKRKLEIDLNPKSQTFGAFNCWVCATTSNRISGTNLFQLLDKLNLQFYRKELEELLMLNNYTTQFVNVEEIENVDTYKNNHHRKIKEFIEQDTISALNNDVAYQYLINRSIDEYDIVAYDIRVCVNRNSKYFGRIIFPSLDEFGLYDYFVSRKTTKFDNNLKYLNYERPVSEIIFNEYIIDFDMPITLVEGVFDSITLKNNSIPLLGKNITKKLYYRLLSAFGNNTDIYLFFDNDAYNDMLNIAKRLYKQGITNVYILKIPEKYEVKDINELKVKYTSNFTDIVNEMYYKSTKVDIWQLLDI